MEDGPGRDARGTTYGNAGAKGDSVGMLLVGYCIGQGHGRGSAGVSEGGRCGRHRPWGIVWGQNLGAWLGVGLMLTEATCEGDDA